MVNIDCYGSMPRLVELDHVHRCLQSLLMDGGWEWLHVVESNQDTDIEELVLGNPKIAKDGLFGCEGECGVRACEINGSDELVYAGI
jgi:hypothetical protein